ncbi:PD-(D/E)XK nuclease family protein [Halogeometricum sp. S1BR25-6]|uniref:PD-(D/E)XK nuclease family protein n=1 Tax=Halogeometricum salsisoli TaxID=2950536 RepID=A0ABU2GKF8_9EURY|nr:PD-(D/E)XK nuclease family protein [Halogeometricum sp. S1BR25-6]MDS0300891.1 PD-(D/E)XK nuclease family protein [Halogeometricum sp. S1BR25-6]
MATNEQLSDRLRDLRISLEAIPEIPEPPKSTFRILGSTHSEQNWNTFLAYFLDPSQPHGFDADLLKNFLDTIQRETATSLEYYHRDIEEIRVETERTSPQNNRLDILIRAPGKWFLWIESKVDSSEGRRQTERYVEDTHVGNEEKCEYPEDGQHYLFLSKQYTADASSDEFHDLSWQHVVDAFQERLRQSHGRYPERSVSQLQDFLSTIGMVTSTDEDDYTMTQKEKIRLLSEYRDDIDELLDAADALRQRALEEWPTLFRSQLDDRLWTEEWQMRDDPGKYGCIFRYGWYRDDENLAPTTDNEATWGNTGFRLHFGHTIRKKQSFSRGELTYYLVCATSVPLRDEFHRVYNSNRWQSKLQPLLEERNITNKGNKKSIMTKTYDVDQSELPESYFSTLATAFEEHRPIAEIVDGVLNESLKNLKRE